MIASATMIRATTRNGFIAEILTDGRRPFRRSLVQRLRWPVIQESWNAMALVLGPLLRRVDGTGATVWVQLSEPGTVTVEAGTAAGAARTFTAYGNHYALVVVDGLAPGTATPYEVAVNGSPVWPPAGDDLPRPVIRTRAPDQPVRLVFGSCRQVGAGKPDALVAYARRLAQATNADQAWPDSLVLLGDQVYADDLDPSGGFGAYAQLYLRSWTEPALRWLLSTVPSVMIFDDHEIIDDWNTSAAWREKIQRQPWWTERIGAGLSSYWVYQHLGNLAPDELAADSTYLAVTTAGDASGVLTDFGLRADKGGYRWSYSLDVASTRLIVLDNRCDRQLEPGHRAMVDDDDWQWFLDRARAGSGYDHLVIGSSLPWLLAPGLHHLEAIDERLCESRRGWVARAAEWLRQALDLEHWAAFGYSFEALTHLVTQLASVPDPPASMTVLSGDVHHSYVARELSSGAYQLTCSPVNNQLPAYMRPALRLAWSAGASRTMRRLARRAGTRSPNVAWEKLAGPYFGNAIGSLVHIGRSAHVTLEGAAADGTLLRIFELDLTRRILRQPRPDAAAG
jgi:hypothetical protein